MAEENIVSEKQEQKNVKIKIGENQEIVAPHRSFKTGRTGYGYYGKIDINGKRCQCSINLIEL